MLVGEYVYKGHLYSIESYDYGDSVVMYLSPNTLEDKRFLDEGIKTEDIYAPAEWDKLYVGVGIGYVNASCYVLEENGVKLKNKLNAPVIVKLGSIIRGMKVNCIRNNQISENLYDVFNPARVISYGFEGLGTISLEIKTIRSLDYDNDVEDIHLHLKEDYSFEEKINKSTSTNFKFALDLSEFSDEDTSFDWDTGSDDEIFNLSEIIEANPNKSYVWLKERKYTIVKSIEETERICRKIWEHKGIVAFDTETTGLNVNVTSRQGIGDVLVGMIFSITPGEAWYFPIKHKKVKNICTSSNEEVIINKYFKPILEKKDILCHNGAFDWKVMYNYGIFTNLTEDTMILFKVTMWNDHRDLNLGLKNLTHLILNRDSFELSDFVKGKFGESVKFWDLEEESVKYYACPDTDNLIELHQYCMDTDLLGKYGAKKIYQIEVAFSIAIAYQEYYGHCVDISKLDSLLSDIKETKETEYAAMVQLVGHDFNPRSNKDLPNILANELKYPVLKRTATGNPSYDKKIREQMMNERDLDGNPVYPFINHLNNYLEACTLESNFTKNIDKYGTEDGLMFSEVKQFLETGRVSVKNPNYQSYSKKVKHYIIPRQNFYAMDFDYSSVEARIMVSMAGCDSMVKKMHDPDTDYHTIKASQMFSIPYELVTPEQRSMSKGVNFGLLYGLGIKNLAKKLFGGSTPEDIKKAKHMKELYFTGMEELKDFITRSKAQGTSQHYSTTFFGRRRYYDPRKTRIDTIERQSCNARIQGTAADIFKVGVVRLLHQIRKNGWLGKVMLSAFVHDECFIEVHKSIDPIKMMDVVRQSMMLDQEGWSPLFIGCGYGRNWYEAKTTEIPVQVQEQLIEKYGETGLDIWDGDVPKLCDFIVDTINDYFRDRVINYLKDENNHHKVLSPVINGFVHSILKDISSGTKIDGCVNSDVSPSKDTIENLKSFGIAFDCSELVEKADIQKAQPVEKKEIDIPDDENSEFVEDDSINEDWHNVMYMYINSVGCFLNSYTEEKSIYFRYYEENASFMRSLHDFFTLHPGDAKLYAVKGNEIFDTGMSVSLEVYPELVKIYAMAR